MKIIFFANNNVGEGLSGGDRIFTELIKHWNNNAEMVLLGSAEAITLSRERGVSNITFIQADEKNVQFNNSLFSFIGHIIRRTRKGLGAIKKEKMLLEGADYVYSVSDFYPDLLPAFIYKRNSKKTKWIAGYYLFAPSPFAADSPYKGTQWLKGLFYWLMQRPSYWLVKRYADYVFVTSVPDVVRFITPNRDRSRIVVIRGGVDITASEQYLRSPDVLPIDHRTYDACFVGRLHYQKGVIGMIDIWKLVCEKRPEAKLGVIGVGPLEEEMKAKIKEYHLENNIDMLGFRDGADKYEIFKQSKLMVHPATYDSGGMAAAEGMAWRLPGVSFDLEALKTYYPKGMMKTEPGNNAQFAEHVIALLEDKEHYQKIAEEAHQLIVDQWDWDKRAHNIFIAITTPDYATDN